MVVTTGNGTIFIRCSTSRDCIIEGILCCLKICITITTNTDNRRVASKLTDTNTIVRYILKDHIEAIALLDKAIKFSFQTLDSFVDSLLVILMLFLNNDTFIVNCKFITGASKLTRKCECSTNHILTIFHDCCFSCSKIFIRFLSILLYFCE